MIQPPEPAAGPPAGSETGPEAGGSTGAHAITQLLTEASGGNRVALDRLMPLVYDELRKLARGRLRFEQAGHTLSTTALVHEAYIKLVDQTRVAWRDRRHFFAVASEAMRRILVDHAKGRQAGKRGGGATHFGIEAADELSAEPLFTADQATELIALDEALRRLAEFNPDGAHVVSYRFFGGLSNEEIADVMETSERSVRRAWAAARAWLHAELADNIGSTSSSLLRSDPDIATS